MASVRSGRAGRTRPAGVRRRLLEIAGGPDLEAEEVRGDLLGALFPLP